MEKAPRIERIGTVIRNDISGELAIQFDYNGKTYEQVISKDAIPDLLTIICSMPSPKSGNPIALAAILPQSVSLFDHDSGLAGLLFQLSAGWALPIALPKEALQDLRKKIDQLELFYSPTKGEH